MLFGKKDVTRYETVKDDSAAEAAKGRLEETLNRLREEESRLQEEINAAPKPQKPAERLAMEAKQLRRRQVAAEQEYAEKQRKFMDELQKKSDKACRMMRQEILNYVDASQDNYTSALRHMLNQMKTGYLRAVRDLLNVNLDQQLVRTQEKLDELIRLIETEGEERTQKLKLAEERRKRAVALLEQGAKLSAELETQMNDHVEQEAL